MNLFKTKEKMETVNMCYISCDKLLCMACLCSGQPLHKITEDKFVEYYMDILKEITVCTPNLQLSMCWKCTDMLKKVIAFREQIKASSRTLLSYPNENHQDMPEIDRLQCNQGDEIATQGVRRETNLIYFKKEVKGDWTHHNSAVTEVNKSNASLDGVTPSVVVDTDDPGSPDSELDYFKEEVKDEWGNRNTLAADVSKSNAPLDAAAPSVVMEADELGSPEPRLAYFKEEENELWGNRNTMAAGARKSNASVGAELTGAVASAEVELSFLKDEVKDEWGHWSRGARKSNTVLNDTTHGVEIDALGSPDHDAYLKEELKDLNKLNHKSNSSKSRVGTDILEYKRERKKATNKRSQRGKETDSREIYLDLNAGLKSKRNRLKQTAKELRKSKAKKTQKRRRLKMDSNIQVIELSYEEMLREREVEAKRESYLSAAYRCESCLLGFSYRNSYRAHNTAKHDQSLGEYCCPVCKTVVPSVEAFTAHYKRHMRRYECRLCQKRTMDMKVMQQHCYSSHDISLTDYKCTVCGKVSKSIGAHRYHRDTHKARIKCPECDKTFSHRAGLLNHRLGVHEYNNEFPCPTCGKAFRWKASLKRHEDRHHAQEVQRAAAFCASCDISFSSVSSYQRHMKNSLKHVSQDDLKFICDECNKRFADKTKLRDHIEEKHLHKTYTCHICNKPSKNRVGLDQHIRNVHKGRPNNKMCHYCGKGFPTKVQLESHIRTHTGERPFICELCPTTFSQQSNLYKHNRQVHMNIKSKRNSVKKKEDPVPTVHIQLSHTEPLGEPLVHYTYPM